MTTIVPESQGHMLIEPVYVGDDYGDIAITNIIAWRVSDDKMDSPEPVTPCGPSTIKDQFGVLCPSGVVWAFDGSLFDSLEDYKRIHLGIK